MPCVLQPWVCELGLRHQGTLLAGIRGCDTAPKDDASKALVRCLRAEILIPFCGDPKKSASFIEGVDDSELERRMTLVLKDHDHYPHHYVGHLTLCAEVIGYKSPNPQGNLWYWFYVQLCRKAHVNQETMDQLDARLNADETTFGAAQHH